MNFEGLTNSSSAREKLLIRRLTVQPRPPRAVRPEVTVRLSDFCLAMIGWEGGKRTCSLSSMHVVADRLEALLAPRRREPWPVIATAALLLASATTGGLGHALLVPRPTAPRAATEKAEVVPTKSLYSAMARSLGADPSHAQTTRFVRLDAVPRAERDRLRQALQAAFPHALSVVDDESALLALDLSVAGWTDRACGDHLTRDYPYALQPGAFPLDRELFRLVTSVETAAGHDIPAVRGDWLLGELVKSPERLKAGAGWPAAVAEVVKAYRDGKIDLAGAALETGLSVAELARRSALLAPQLPANLRILLEGGRAAPRKTGNRVSANWSCRWDWVGKFARLCLAMPRPCEIV